MFRILVADSQMSAEQAVSRIESGMNAHVNMAGRLLEGQDELLEQMRRGQRELRGSLQDTVTVLGLLPSEVGAGNQAAAETLARVRADVQRLEEAFGELSRQLFGLTLLRPKQSASSSSSSSPPSTYGCMGTRTAAWTSC